MPTIHGQEFHSHSSPTVIVLESVLLVKLNPKENKQHHRRQRQQHRKPLYIEWFLKNYSNRSRSERDSWIIYLVKRAFAAYHFFVSLKLHHSRGTTTAWHRKARYICNQCVLFTVQSTLCTPCVVSNPSLFQAQ